MCHNFFSIHCRERSAMIDVCHMTPDVLNQPRTTVPSRSSWNINDVLTSWGCYKYLPDFNKNPQLSTASGMDPLSALSLAACIAQFIDFGSKLVSFPVDRWYVHYMHVRAYCSLSLTKFSTEGPRAYGRDLTFRFLNHWQGRWLSLHYYGQWLG